MREIWGCCDVGGEEWGDNVEMNRCWSWIEVDDPINGEKWDCVGCKCELFQP